MKQENANFSEQTSHSDVVSKTLFVSDTTQTNASNKPFPYAVFALGTIVALSFGGIAAYSMKTSTMSLSKFDSGVIVTSNNASSLWKPGADNPFRAKIDTDRVQKLDALILAILNKGKTADNANFSTFLTNLSTGIANIGKKPEYSGSTEVQDILGFLVYEVNATASVLQSSSNQSGTQSGTQSSTQSSTQSNSQSGTTQSTTSNTSLNQGAGSSQTGSQTAVQSRSGSAVESTQTGTSVAISQPTPEQLASQMKLHSAYTSLYSLKQLRFIENETLYARHVANPEKFTYQNYLDAREPVVTSGFRSYFDPFDSKNCHLFPVQGKNCFVGGQTSLAQDNGYYNLTFSEMTFGQETEERMAPARQFQSLNPEFKGDGAHSPKKIRVYLPKGTVAVNIFSYVPQWQRFAVAARIGNAPSSTKTLSPVEYINNFSKTNEEYYRTDMNRLLAGEEVVISSNGGGMFAYPGHDKLALYEKPANMYSQEQLASRDSLALSEGSWLYISQLEGNVSNITVNITVKSDVYRANYGMIQFDASGDPAFVPFKNSQSSNDPYAGDTRNLAGTITSVEQIAEMQKWVIDSTSNSNQVSQVQ